MVLSVRAIQTVEAASCPFGEADAENDVVTECLLCIFIIGNCGF